MTLLEAGLKGIAYLALFFVFPIVAPGILTGSWKQAGIVSAIIAALIWLPLASYTGQFVFTLWAIAFSTIFAIGVWFLIGRVFALRRAQHMLPDDD